jgi:hypothetical protein
MPETPLPTVRYHPTERSRLIETPEDLAALGPEWQDTPYTPEARAQWQAQQATAPAAEETTTPPARRR